MFNHFLLISNQVINELLNQTDWKIVTFDRLSYSGNLKRIDDIRTEINERKIIIHQKKNKHWETFLELINILQYFTITCHL